MARLVQKFGGSSLATVAQIKSVATKIRDHVHAGDEVVVVVSAMHGETDRLLTLASTFNASSDNREMAALVTTGEQVSAALLSLALQQLDIKAISLTGVQAGIQTENRYTKANIVNIDREKILSWLPTHVPIVTGYQGANSVNEQTTLGRGGSDLTALAIAYATNADECQIYTDVTGIYSADPRIVRNAKLLRTIYYPEMLAMASCGSKVLQMRAVEFGIRYGIPLRVLSSMQAGSGTQVLPTNLHSPVTEIVGLAYQSEQLIFEIEPRASIQSLLQELQAQFSHAVIDSEMIIFHEGHPQLHRIKCCVIAEDEQRARHILDAQVSADKLKYKVRNNFDRLSLVGLGLESHARLSTQIFGLLAEHQIQLEMLSSYPARISMVLDKTAALVAAPLLHEAFVSIAKVKCGAE